MENDNKAHKAIAIALSVFILIALLYVLYWAFWGRFYQYTNDAYVDGNSVIVTPQVPGIVTSLSALSTDFVPEGRILVELDKTDALIALDRSVASLGSSVRQVQQMFENVRMLQASIAMKKALFVRAAQDFERRKPLVEDGSVSVEDFQHAEAGLQASYADLIATEHDFIAAASLVENTSIDTHPLVNQAKNQVRDAYVFLERCTITAPVAGIVAQRTVQVGERVNPAQPLLAIVPLNQMWITANFKEVQLGKMRIGQPVEVKSDIYGRGVLYHGTVVGIGGGTGSVFSVLPPQNATGNWIKIVQRLPVKIDIPQQELQEHPLRLGLSMEVTVDIRHTDCPIVPEIKPDEPIYATDVFADQEEGAEALILQVIEDNLAPLFMADFSEVQE